MVRLCILLVHDEVYRRWNNTPMCECRMYFAHKPRNEAVKPSGGLDSRCYSNLEIAWTFCATRGKPRRNRKNEPAAWLYPAAWLIAIGYV